MPIVSSPGMLSRIRVAALFSGACSSRFAGFAPGFGSVRGRDLDVEDGAAAVVGLDPDPAAHPADKLPGDVQAEPSPADSPRHVRIEPVELLEDPGFLGTRYAESLVGDGEANVVVGRFHPDA